MMSRSKKQETVESDSDWDSLPGDVPEPGSSPEPTNSPSPRIATHSPVPAPPKQPYSKHNTSTKPVNMYKNTSNVARKSGSATTFEDRTGGINWDDEDDQNENIKISFSKENNNVRKTNEITKENKDARQTRNVQTRQEKTKKPPFTDFREALSSPIPPTINPREQLETVAGVNQAYRIETGDEMKTTGHDSWDDSENESQMPQSHSQQIQKNVGQKMQQTNRHVHQPPTETKSNRQELTIGANPKTTYHLRALKKDKGDDDIMKMSYEKYQSFGSNQNFENCCLIQVAQGPFDDRHRPSFFHGSKNHFHVREDDPRATITDIAEKSEVILQRFWREVFGVLQILLNFFLIFILELYKTVVLNTRYLLTGILYTTGDHFIKPLLSAIFNNIVQPFSVLLLNIFSIFTNLLKPLLALTREIFSQVAIPLQAFRLFVFNWDYRKNEESSCQDVKVV